MFGPAATTSRKDFRHFLLRRVHSLSGVLPIGVFLVQHLYTNFQAVGPGGAQRFDATVAELQHNPVVIYAEIFGIGLPILYHAFYGLFIAAQARNNATRYRYGANWRFLFQRVTGILLVGYIGYHVYMTRLQPELHPQRFPGGIVDYDYMHAYLTGTLAGVPIWVGYIIGTSAAVFHLANGLWGFLIHWGVTVGPRAQRVSAWACAGFGAALLALGLGSLYAFVVKSGAGVL